MTVSAKLELNVYPLTPRRWDDFVTLFGDNGACGGCWCMNWRLPAKEFNRNKGEGNKRLMKSLVDRKIITGLIAYDKREPIGWISVAPREDYPRIENAPTLKRIDDKPVWSVTCFFIRRDYRTRGVSVKLLEAAIEYVKKKGGTIVEGYPYDVKSDGSHAPGAFVWTGITPAFKKAGFRIAKRRGLSRPIMRYYIK
jgi:GNAT superfamily N-acetyltransferase